MIHAVLRNSGPNTIVEKHTASNGSHRVPLLVLRPKQSVQNAPGILWIHGGGYILGMKEMVYMSRATALADRYGAVVVSPGYRMAFQKRYPAAISDCYTALLWLNDHAKDLGIDPGKIMVGGESAGGGLCAALCMIARDRGEVRIAFQMPLYPMLDDRDTDSSRNNHGRIWNTRRNHFGWRAYLGKAHGKDVPCYAAPARQTDYTGLPPCYTFVCTGEPFRDETIAYVEHLRNAGVKADIDIYPGSTHAFDMLYPDEPVSRQAISTFERHFAEAAGFPMKGRSK